MSLVISVDGRGNYSGLERRSPQDKNGDRLRYGPQSALDAP
jgi:hypothetical protein